LSSRSFEIAALTALALVASTARADVLPPGTFLYEAAAFDVTVAVLNEPLQDLAASIPSQITIGTSPGQELIDLLLCSEDFWVENLWIRTEVQNLELLAGPTGMHLDVDIGIQVNQSNDPAYVVMDGCFDFVCTLYTNPAVLSVDLPIEFEMANGPDGPFIDATIGPLSNNLGLILDSRLHFGSCGLTDINNWLINNFDFDLFEMVIDEFLMGLDQQLGGALAEAEVAIEGVLAGLWIDGEIELAERFVEYQIEPTRVEHHPVGLRLKLGGVVSADPDPCTDAWDLGGSAFTESPMPPLLPEIAGTSVPYHFAATFSDDFINQALHAVWRSGVLCFAAEQLGDTDLTTDVLSLLVGPEVGAAFTDLLSGEQGAMLVRTLPTRPPVVRFDGVMPLTIDLMEFGVEFFLLDLLGRPSRVVGMYADLSVGIDVFVDSTGAMVLDVVLEEDELRTRVVYNELLPGHDAAFAAAMPAFIDLAITALLGSGLSGAAFPLPTLGGLGLADLELVPVGAGMWQLDWLVGYGTLGPSTGGEGTTCDSEACGGEAGCAGEGCGELGAGCEGGCGGDLGGDLLGGGCDAEEWVLEQGCSGRPGSGGNDDGCPGLFDGCLGQGGCGVHGRGPRRLGLAHAWLLLPILISRRRRPSR
jgi:hypothetical protein